MKQKYIPQILFMLFIICIATAGCGKKADASSQSSTSSQAEGESVIQVENLEYPVLVSDVSLPARPNKVVSLSPAITEKLYDLGFEDRLLGVSDYCDYPELAPSLRLCGTAQIPDVEQILSISPHLLLVSSPLSEEDLKTFTDKKITVAVIPYANSIDALKQNYIDLARLFEGDATGTAIGEKFCDNLQDRLDSLKETTAARIPEGGRKTALYLRLLNFTVATGDTIEHQLLEIIGLDNVAKDYKDWNYPAEAANTPEGKKAFQSVSVIFCDSSVVDIKMLEQNAYYKPLPAVLKDWYFYTDNTVFERQSLRMIDALEKMAEYAYSS